MAAYHIGRIWNSCLETTNVTQVWNDPSFRSLDDHIMTNLDDIKDAVKMVSGYEVNMHDFDPQHAALVNDDSWKTVWLKYFGRPIPCIKGILRTIVDHPIVYNASLSILEPGGSIPMHVGQCQALVKYHVPISIPKGDCHMVYNGRKYTWDDRMLFNDTLPHMVVNNTSERRVIILMDILRPMSIPWNFINESVAKSVWIDPVVRQRYQQICSRI
jgi:ornithine lipid ester-linked acyl 2-hydroxylase